MLFKVLGLSVSPRGLRYSCACIASNEFVLPSTQKVTFTLKQSRTLEPRGQYRPLAGMPSDATLMLSQYATYLLKPIASNRQQSHIKPFT